MFLQIVGWLALVAFMFSLTAAWSIMALNHLGQWTIGGASNTMQTRLMTFVFGVIIFGGWYATMTSAPFTITFGS